MKDKKEIKKIDFIKKLGIKIDDEGRCNINNTELQKLKPMPQGNRYKEVILRDKNLLGFRARCNGGGSISFIVRYRPKEIGSNGKPLEKQNVTIGKWINPTLPENKGVIGMTPTVARNLAKEMMMKIAKKEDPYSLLKARKKGRSILSYYSDWVEKRLNSANFKANSIKNYESRYDVYIRRISNKEDHRKLYRNNVAAFSILRKPIKEVTKDDYISLHNAISTHSKYQANKVIEDLRLVENYAIELGALDKRVCIFKKKELNKEHDRLDVTSPYSPEEMKRYRKAALKLIKENRQQNLIPCCVLLAAGLLGGRSKSMIFCLTWDQIDFKNNLIRWQETKNSEPIIIDFDYRFRALLKIMAAHRQTINHRDKRYRYVFPSAKKEFKTKHINDPRKTHRSIIELAKLDYKCIHFLRHSWATNTQEATGDMKATKEMGGWKSMAAVEKYVDVSRRIMKQRLIEQRKYLAKSHVA